MSTTKEFRDYVLEELDLLDNIICRSMMGEYLLYCDGVLFGGIYDSRILVKIVDTNLSYNMSREIPYKGAKEMFLVDTEDKELIREIVLSTCEGLNKRIS